MAADRTPDTAGSTRAAGHGAQAVAVVVAVAFIIMCVHNLHQGGNHARPTQSLRGQASRGSGARKIEMWNIFKNQFR